MKDQASKMAPRRIAMLIYPGCDIIDACGPLDVFAFANFWFYMTGTGPAPACNLALVGERAGPMPTFAGMRVVADYAIGEIDEEIDTLLVAGGPYIESGRKNRALIKWIRSMEGRVRRIGSVYTGAFLLAESGILEGRRATTHWGNVINLSDHKVLL